MAIVRLAIDAELCGPISVGTVAVVRVLHAHLRIPIDAATDYVDRCVFENETVELELATTDAAAALVSALAGLQSASRISARLVSDGAEQRG